MMRFRKFRLTKSKVSYIVYFIIVLFLLLLFFFFNKQLTSIVFTIMLIILGSMSSMFKKMTGNLNLGIEFITFSTILFIYSYGIAFALIACLVMTLLSTLLTGQISPTSLTSYGMYVIIALIALFLPFGIATSGIILVLIMNFLGLFILLMLGFDFVRNLLYISGNIFFNFVLFKYFSQIIFTLL